MKLSEITFCLDWPASVKVINLRKYLIENLKKKGDLIRWSIVNIQNPMNACDIKKLYIRAVMLI